MKKRQPPRITGRRQAARTRIFNIEEVDLEFSNGAHRTYERVLGSNRGAVLVAPLTSDRELLLVREYATGMQRYELTFVKGNVDPGEDMLQAANRELQEEIAQAARVLRHLHSITTAPGYLRHTTHVVLAQELYPASRDGDEPEPLEQVRWPLERLDALLEEEEFTDARSVATIYLLQRHLDI
ncbi:MAG: ADP compounds hydrolase NudE [Pseudomonadota bacterium]